MTDTFNFNYKRAYQVSSSWKTLVDEVYSGGEQRRNLWSSSRKKWILEFDKNGTDSNSIMEFFNARKGRYEAFYWTWEDSHPVTGESLGGDGEQYTVRFDHDELNLEHLGLGYSKFQVTLVEVRD